MNKEKPKESKPASSSGWDTDPFAGASFSKPAETKTSPSSDPFGGALGSTDAFGGGLGSKPATTQNAFGSSSGGAMKLGGTQPPNNDIFGGFNQAPA